jgi:hypothetical protein
VHACPKLYNLLEHQTTFKAYSIETQVYSQGGAAMALSTHIISLRQRDQDADDMEGASSHDLEQ